MPAGGRSSAPEAPSFAAPATAWRVALLLAIVAGSFLALMAWERFGQDPAYHGLADRRSAFGIPNFADVVSNLAFLLVGLAGLRLCATRRLPGARTSWIVFFAGVALVSAGSAYYHLAPRDATLVWDRLPMTIACMGLFVALICEHVDARIEGTLLAVAVLVGLASVVYWYAYDDLRPYVWVQLAPLVTIPVALVLFNGRYGGGWYLAAGLAFYVLAKIAELYDHPILAWTRGLVSGHTLKHLLAALACFAIYAMLARRVGR